MPLVAGLAAIVALGADGPPASTKDDSNNSCFQKPVRLEAGGAVIDSGGPSGPIPARVSTMWTETAGGICSSAISAGYSGSIIMWERNGSRSCARDSPHGRECRGQGADLLMHRFQSTVCGFRRGRHRRPDQRVV